jgi:phosphoribosylformimino-5-aminoimidazole carboxamide ribotide isomerase
MLIPSIDLMGGRIVQLERGSDLKLAFDDFDYWIERFSSYPIVQLVDLDAAMGQGDNAALMTLFVKRLPCQVGGGIRTPDDAIRILDAGAHRVIFGSALFNAQGVNTTAAESISHTIGPEHFVSGIDTKAGQVAIRGWKETITLTPEEAIAALEPYCSAFLYTHVDTEGTLQGFPFERARGLRALTSRQLIVAGGIRDRSEIDTLHSIGVDAVAGMAVYTGLMPA